MKMRTLHFGFLPFLLHLCCKRTAWEASECSVGGIACSFWNSRLCQPWKCTWSCFTLLPLRATILYICNEPLVLFLTCSGICSSYLKTSHIQKLLWLYPNSVVGPIKAVTPRHSCLIMTIKVQCSVTFHSWEQNLNAPPKQLSPAVCCWLEGRADLHLVNYSELI